MILALLMSAGLAATASDKAADPFAVPKVTLSPVPPAAPPAFRRLHIAPAWTSVDSRHDPARETGGPVIRTEKGQLHCWGHTFQAVGKAAREIDVEKIRREAEAAAALAATEARKAARDAEIESLRARIQMSEKRYEEMRARREASPGADEDVAALRETIRTLEKRLADVEKRARD